MKVCEQLFSGLFWKSPQNYLWSSLQLQDSKTYQHYVTWQSSSPVSQFQYANTSESAPAWFLHLNTLMSTDKQQCLLWQQNRPDQQIRLFNLTFQATTLVHEHALLCMICQIKANISNLPSCFCHPYLVWV